MRHISSVALLAALLLVPARGEEPKQAAEAEGQYLVFLADSRPVLIRVHVSIDGKSVLKSWEGFIGDIFDSADTNKDGILDKAEMAKVPPPPELFGAGGIVIGGARLLGAMPAAAVPGDAKVTRQGLADYYRKSGGAPLQLAQGNNNQEMYRRAFLDVTGQIPAQGQADALNKALMSLLDTDKDGKLSRKELEAAPAVLLKRDANDDEMITPGELQGQMERNTGEFELVLGGSGFTPLGADGPMIFADPRASSRSLADSLLKRYGGSTEAKKSSKLTAKDLGLDAETFKKLDADEDGVLDREELARFARRTPDAELSIEIGAKQTSSLKLLGKPKDLRIEKLSLGQAGKGKEAEVPALCVGNTVLVLKLGGGGGGGIMIAPPAVADEDAFYKMQFTAADADNNGYLDEAEARRNGVFAANFKAMDADGDGKLYLKEVLAFLKSRTGLRERARSSCATLTFSDQGRGLFDLLDADGDGRLSVREMRQAAKRLLELDRDKDGSLAMGEIPRRHQLGAQRGGAGGDSVSGVFAISLSGPMSAPKPARKEGPLWFRKMDRNSDGDVSRREFLGTDEQFRQIDKDGDGLISVKEAEEFDAAQRKK